ncbi:MAG: hypothetical protein ABIK83_08125 [Candidatus Zixiibacteriota bacterium]
MSFVKEIAKQAFRFIDPALAYGPVYRMTLKQLSAVKVDSDEDLDRLERTKLQNLFRRLKRDVPFYRDSSLLSWDCGSADPKEILHKLPLITKAMIRDDIEEFTAQSIPGRDLSYVTTGGSTAAPLGFFELKRISEGIERAYIHTIWGRAGYHRTTSCAVFRGTVVQKRDSKRLWFYDPFYRSMIYSSYHLNGDDLQRIYDHLLDFNPQFIQAYPSAANLLAAYIEESGKPPPSNLKTLLLGSESLPIWQRRRIESAFGAAVFSWYGHAEKAILAAEKPGGTDLYVLPTYGYAYLRSEDGVIITEPGVPGEIIATGFTNRATYFVNYRTGDVGTWADSHDPGHRILKKVEGRAQELAITAGGRKISMTAINMHTDIFDHVKQFRFVQDVKGRIRMEIVRKSDYSSKNERYIIDGISEKLGEDMELEIAYVESIPRAKSGKARFLVQNIKGN